MNSSVKTGLVAAGAMVVAVIILNQFGPTAKLLNGDVTAAEAMTLQFWKNR